MQHHIWLSTNAKTLLTLVPGGYPWVNFVVVSVIYVAVSHRLFRLTISLRAMLIPNTTRSALVYLALMAAFAATCGLMAGLLTMVSASNFVVVSSAVYFGNVHLTFDIFTFDI